MFNRLWSQYRKIKYSMTPSNNSLSFLTFVGTTDLCTHLHKVSQSMTGCVLLQGVSIYSLYFLCEFDNFSFIFLRILHEEKIHISTSITHQKCIRNLAYALIILNSLEKSISLVGTAAAVGEGTCAFAIISGAIFDLVISSAGT